MLCTTLCAPPRAGRDAAVPPTSSTAARSCLSRVACSSTSPSGSPTLASACWNTCAPRPAGGEAVFSLNTRCCPQISLRRQACRRAETELRASRRDLKLLQTYVADVTSQVAKHHQGVADGAGRLHELLGVDSALSGPVTAHVPAVRGPAARAAAGATASQEALLHALSFHAATPLEGVAGDARALSRRLRQSKRLTVNAIAHARGVAAVYAAPWHHARGARDAPAASKDDDTRQQSLPLLAAQRGAEAAVEHDGKAGRPRSRLRRWMHGALATRGSARTQPAADSDDDVAAGAGRGWGQRRARDGDSGLPTRAQRREAHSTGLGQRRRSEGSARDLPSRLQRAHGGVEAPPPAPSGDDDDVHLLDPAPALWMLRQQVRTRRHKPARGFAGVQTLTRPETPHTHTPHPPAPS